MDDLVTLAQAAESLGLAPTTLRAQVGRGRPAATKIGKTWITTPQEVERYRRESKGKVGRPFAVPSEEPPPRPRFSKWSAIRRPLSPAQRAEVDAIKRAMDEAQEP
jgi:hypothetical protein